MINDDKTSVMYNPGDKTFFDLDIQGFEYIVSVVPRSISNDTVIGIVKLNFRVSPNELLYPKCDANMNQIINGSPRKPMRTTTER